MPLTLMRPSRWLTLALIIVTLTAVVVKKASSEGTCVGVKILSVELDYSREDRKPYISAKALPDVMGKKAVEFDVTGPEIMAGRFRKNQDPQDLQKLFKCTGNKLTANIPIVYEVPSGRNNAWAPLIKLTVSIPHNVPNVDVTWSFIKEDGSPFNPWGDAVYKSHFLSSN